MYCFTFQGTGRKEPYRVCLMIFFVQLDPSGNVKVAKYIPLGKDERSVAVGVVKSKAGMMLLPVTSSSET